MGTLGYLPQVICETTLHFGSKTMGVLRTEGLWPNGWKMQLGKLNSQPPNPFFTSSLTVLPSTRAPVA